MSIGHKGVAIPGIEKWFDTSRGIISNIHGLIDGSTPTIGGLYVSGWLKRGPSGIIGTNIADAKDTVATILENVKEFPHPKQASKTLQDYFQENQIKSVDWKAYLQIEAVETSEEQKRNSQQPREKITNRQEQLKVAFMS